jgi:TnpA family transposase
MTRRYLLTEDERQSLFGIPLDRASLANYYTIPPEDRVLVEVKRSDANRLGFALQLVLLRHPGFGYRHDELLPDNLIHHVAQQLDIPFDALSTYAARTKTRLEHGWSAAEELRLRTFDTADLSYALDLAKFAALSTDQGLPIATAIVDGLRGKKIILPAPARIERIGVAGRARARKLAADTIVDALTAEQITALDALLIVNPGIGVTPLAWLRDTGDSPSAKSFGGLLERLSAVRRISLDPAISTLIHERRFRQLVREGAVAPAFLLSDYSERRRRATLAASLIDLEIRYSDAAIQMFSKLTGALFTKARASQKRRMEATSKDVGRLMRLFGSTLDALMLAREDALDPWDVIDTSVGWHHLLRAAPEVQAIADLAQEDPLVRASDKYLTLRRFAPAFLEAFSFKAARKRDPVLAAVALIRALNASGRRDVPADAPLPFRKNWKAAIIKGGQIDRRLYETATIASLRERLESRDIWVEGTRDHLRFDAYLLPRDEVAKVAEQLPFDTNANTYLESRAKLLDWRLRRFASALRRGKLEGVEMRGDALHVAPLQAITPQAAERLDAKIDRMMPHVRITELLAEVASHTGFVSGFAELRSGRIRPNPEALLAAILADATNLGVERMANASQGVTYAQIAWTHGWYLSEENYAAALAKIADAQRALPLSTVWGDGTASSSDGQFFRSGRKGSAGTINAKYGNEPGQKIYTHVSDQYAPFHSQLITATAGEAPYVLDGLVSHGTGLEIATHYADTGGSLDHVFALSHLLGFRFVPRLRDLTDRKLGIFPGANVGAILAPLIGRPFNFDVIRECWDEIVRLAASIKAGTVLPSVMLKKLGAHRRQNRLDFALQEIGRIERALFTLDWLESKQLRQQCQAGLNKGEARH